MALSVDIAKHLSGFDLHVSFAVEKSNEVLALLGPSGCGKSMTLKCIAGIVKPDSGRIVLNDRALFDSEAHVNVPPQERHVGYLFQSYALFPHMSVMQNVLVGAQGATRAEREACALEQLKKMRLEGLLNRRSHELSGGQQQRCAMARILASKPDLILLDEPFSALDSYLRWQLELELSDTLRAFPGGTIYVSHNRDEVYRLCDSVCVINQGSSDKKVSVKELFSTPVTLAAARISGCKNVSRAHKVGEKCLFCDDWGLNLTTALPMDDSVTYVGIRAHYFKVVGCTTEYENVIPCEVDRVIDNTFSTIVMARTPGGTLLRYECSKESWASLGEPQRILFYIAPECVMPLRDSAKEYDAAEEKKLPHA